MQICSYDKFKKPNSQYAVVIAHQECQPYIRQWNYFECISLPNISSYCGEYDIDLIIIDNFHKGQTYISSQDSNFNNRVNTFPFIATKELLKHYKYILLWNGNDLMKLNYPHFKDIVPNLQQYDCVRFRGVQPYPEIYDDRIEDSTGWNGHTSIVNGVMAKHWFDQNQLVKCKMNDLQYRKRYNQEHGSQFRMLTVSDKYLLNIDYWCVQAMMRGNNGSAQQVMRWIMNNVDFQPMLEDEKYLCTFFGGCGSYSSIWKLRVLLMIYHTNKYRKFYY